MAPSTSPCRLHVFLARDARVGVILRRGPSAWAQLVRWDRSVDTFEPGQWTRARVYGRRSDLSPDGRLLVYFAARYGRFDDPRSGSWTAISRPPYFTGLASWPNLGSWYGGGVFELDGRVLLDATCTLEPDSRLGAPPLDIGTCPVDSAPWEQRLLRDGWTLLERGFDPRTHPRVGEREVWRKERPGGGIALCREVEEWDVRRYGGPHGDTFWLETGDDLIPLPDVTWADWDGDDPRLLAARRGELHASDRPEGLATGADDTLLFDLNPLEPVEVIPPEWARSWPAPGGPRGEDRPVHGGDGSAAPAS